MKDKLLELKAAIILEGKITKVIAERRAKFEEENANLFLNQTEAREIISGCKIVLSDHAIIGFRQDGEKKRLGGLGIRVMQDLAYEDKDALNWAKEHSLCLKLDSSAFKKIAKTQDFDFVQKLDRISVTFPKEINLEEE